MMLPSAFFSGGGCRLCLTSTNPVEKGARLTKGMSSVNSLTG
jgi:hypothetical protein